MWGRVADLVSVRSGAVVPRSGSTPFGDAGGLGFGDGWGAVLGRCRADQIVTISSDAPRALASRSMSLSSLVTTRSPRAIARTATLASITSVPPARSSEGHEA